jgi:hypothetical protein
VDVLLGLIERPRNRTPSTSSASWLDEVNFPLSGRPNVVCPCTGVIIGGEKRKKIKDGMT